MEECSLEHIKKVLSKKHACYVLITCEEPTDEGKMDVEMTYDGDEALASYLVESAQSIFEDYFDQTIDSC